jgi:hypothetical protein
MAVKCLYQMFKSSQPQTNVFQSLALETIGPTKIFRRSFLLEKGRFPAGVCTAEDQPFMVQAYLLAGSLSMSRITLAIMWSIILIRSMIFLCQ